MKWLSWFLIFWLAISHNVRAEFMKTAVIWSNNTNVTQEYCNEIAPYDLIWGTRLSARADWCGGYYPCVWDYLHTKNPDIKIFIYISPLEVNRTHDTWNTRALNDLGRYQNARGHSMGTIDSHPGFYLRDANGTIITRTDSQTDWLQLDGGNSTLQQYVHEVLATDIIDYTERKYVADGINFDNCDFVRAYNKSRSVKYPTTDAWGDMMINFISSQSSYLHSRGQLLWTNSGTPRDQEGYNNWIKWANSQDAIYPDYILEEGGVCAEYGGGDIQFYPSGTWKRSVDAQLVLGAKTAVVLSNPLGSYWRDNTSGTDNLGDSVTRDDILQFVFASWAVAWTPQNVLSVFYTNGTTPYFGFMASAKRKDGRWNLGDAVAPYYTKTVDGAELFIREFEDGYVIVNPGNTSITNTIDLIADLGITGAVKRIDHQNLNNPVPAGRTTKIAGLARHRAVVLKKFKNFKTKSSLIKRKHK